MERFVALIEEELEKAGASEVEPKDYYESIMKTAKQGGPEHFEVNPAPAHSPFLGPDKAPVVIQVYSDLECPFCGRAHPTVQKLLQDFPGKIKLVWRHYPLPFHSHAKLAAQAAEEAKAQRGNAGFWQMVELLFQNQEHLTRTDLEGYAGKLGLDLPSFQQALDDGRHLQKLDADEQARIALDVQGTPTFFVNGYKLSGAQPYPAFERVVRRALSAKP
jgi:protein-disulfide isomerase